MEQVGTERAIQERSPGRWAIVLEVRDEATGKRKRRWHSFKGTKRQAQDECARLITDLKNGNALEPNKTTVAQFLERWLDHIRTQVSPKSHERYAGIVHQNLIPALGAVRLNKLKPVQISTTYSTALIGGRRDGTGGLSPRTVGHMHRVLKQALGQALKWKELIHNPGDAVDPPRVDWKPMTYRKRLKSSDRCGTRRCLSLQCLLFYVASGAGRFALCAGAASI
jgi:hypothetical protein